MEPTMPVGTNGFKDRTTGLMIFGILQILAGGMCLFSVPMMLVGQFMSKQSAAGGTEFRMILPSIVVYLLLAAILISIGIGSIKARRWARALALIMGWSWLITGIFSVAMSSFLLFHIFSADPNMQKLPPGAMTVMVTVMVIMFSVMFVIVPGALVLFYGRKDVKATCERRDPVMRWTDKIPLPVLALALWIAFGAASMLVMPFAYNGVLPLFGKLITGMPGTVLTLAIAALWAYAGMRDDQSLLLPCVGPGSLPLPQRDGGSLGNQCRGGAFVLPQSIQSVSWRSLSKN